MELKYFKSLQGQWLEFGKDDVIFDRYLESAIEALDAAFASKNLTARRAKNYLNKMLAFAQQRIGESHWHVETWYAESVNQKFLDERVPAGDGYTTPLRNKLSRFNNKGLATVAKTGLYLLKDIDGGIEAKVVPNPTGVACECPG